MRTIGLSQLGSTASSADRMAQERADTAVVSALVPFCVFKAQQDPDQGPLIKFQAEQSFYYPIRYGVEGRLGDTRLR